MTLCAYLCVTTGIVETSSRLCLFLELAVCDSSICTILLPAHNTLTDGCRDADSMACRKLAVVTGGGGGIGRALALSLVDRLPNLDVLIVGRRPDALLETRAAAVQLQGEQAAQRLHVVAADVAADDGREAVASAVRELSLPLQCLVHNAATLGPVDSLLSSTVTPVSWASTFTTNVEGPLFLSRALLPELEAYAREHGDSRILHISSGAAHHVYPGMSAYCASKAAFYSLYESLRDELAPRSVAVGSVRPGVVDTDMMTALRAAPTDDISGRYRDLKQNQPQSRDPVTSAPPEHGLDTPENVGSFLTWLLTGPDAEEFSKTEWNIKDPWHHVHWTGSRTI